MFEFIFNLIGDLLGEDRNPGTCEPEEPQDSPQNPDNFCPGLLFDLSATWILFIRKLLLAESLRGGKRGCPHNCDAKCGNHDAKCSKSSPTPVVKTADTGTCKK